jgi:cytidine deaminase
VGCALLANGKIYVGFNIENASYSLSICAERTAAVNAIIDGSRDFQKLALASDGKDFIVPCGACLQFLAEFSKNMDIIIVNGQGDNKTTTLKELFPVPFEL